MRRLALAVVLAMLLLAVSVTAASAAVIKDFTFVPQDHAVDITFTAEGYDSAVVSWTNSLEKGTMKLKAQDGVFSGTISLPASYPGNNVAVTIKSSKGKELMKKTYVQTALTDIPAVEKAASGRLTGVTVCVDPGHQGVAIGLKEPMGPGLSGTHHTTNGQAQGTVTRRMESVVVLEIGLKLRNALLEEGADVVMRKSRRKAEQTCSSGSTATASEIKTSAESMCLFRSAPPMPNRWRMQKPTGPTGTPFSMP